MLHYVGMKSESALAQHKHGLGLVASKSIVFFISVQGHVYLALDVVISQKLTGCDLTYGSPAALIAGEQLLFAIFY